MKTATSSPRTPNDATVISDHCHSGSEYKMAHSNRTDRRLICIDFKLTDCSEDDLLQMPWNGTYSVNNAHSGAWLRIRWTTLNSFDRWKRISDTKVGENLNLPMPVYFSRCIHTHSLPFAPVALCRFFLTTPCSDFMSQHFDVGSRSLDGKISKCPTGKCAHLIVTDRNNIKRETLGCWNM